MGTESYELALLLTLKDRASPGLNKFTHDLHKLQGESRGALRDYQHLQHGISRGLSVGGTGGGLRGLLGQFKMLRTELGQPINIGGIALGAAGLGGLKLVQGGLRDSASKEEALLKLRTSIMQLGKDGSSDIALLNNQMSQFELLGERLGNKLPGNTEMYLDLFATLKQRGLDVKTVMEGAGEAASLLSTANDAVPRDIGKSLATFGQLYKLQGQEYVKAADLFSRLYTSKQLDSGELIEASKYFTGRTGSALGLTGLKGAEDTTRFLAFIREKSGMEGSQLGTSTSTFFTQLVKHRKDLTQLEKTSGVKLDIFDKKGEFQGLENAVKKFAQLKGKLSQEQVIKFGTKIAGDEGKAVFQALVNAGDEWKSFNDSIDSTVPLMQKVDILMGGFNAKMESLQGTLTNLNAQSFESMLKTLGPIVDKTNTLVGALQGIAKAHPAMAATVTWTLAIGSGLLTIAGALATLRFGLGIFNLLRSGAASSATAIASAGSQASTLKGRIESIPRKWSTSVNIIGVGMVISELASLAAEFERRRQQFSDLREGGQTSLEDFKEHKDEYREQGQGELYKHARQLALEGFKSVNVDRTLEIALNPQGVGDAYKSVFDNPYKAEPPWWSPLQSDQPFSRPTAVQRFQQIGKQFDDPDVMKATLREASAGRFDASLGKEGVKSFIDILSASFPKVFAEAQKSIAEDTARLSEPMQKTAANFNDMLGPMGRVPGLFSQVADAASGLSFRLNSFTPTTGPFSSGPVGDSGGSTGKPGSTFTERFGGGKALGGRVIKDVSYIGGERGQELFTPATDGFVIPHHALPALMRDRSAQDGGAFLPFAKGTQSPNVLNLFGGFKARGGRVLKDVSYIGGERGTELFTPGTDGYIPPNNVLTSLTSIKEERTNTILPPTLDDSIPFGDKVGPRLTTAAQEQSTNLRGGDTNTGPISINIYGANNPRAVAREVVDTLERRLAMAERKLNDSRRFDRLADRALGLGEERS
jgi:TP901 family phage tail tape measure protein